MKRMLFCMLALTLLTGCGLLRETSYVVVVPHDEDYQVSVDSDVLVVSSYLSLKNAILSMVQDCRDEGVIRAEHYTGELSEDLSQAVNEVTQMSPVGAYAVSTMTYDYSRIVSYYEIHLHTVYKQTREEIQSIQYVTDSAMLRARLLEAMEQGEDHLVLRTGDYEALDPAAELDTIYFEHPDFVLERPEIDEEVFPDSGSQRIMELRLTYLHTPEELDAARQALEQQVETVAELYGTAYYPETNLWRLLNRLARKGELEQSLEEPHSFTNSAYGALCEGRATSFGYAQAYRLLAERCGFSCRVVSGELEGQSRSWCLVTMGDQTCYLDPARWVGERPSKYFLLGTKDLENLGYVLPVEENLPESELPPELRPPGSAVE